MLYSFYQIGATSRARSVELKEWCAPMILDASIEREFAEKLKSLPQADAASLQVILHEAIRATEIANVLNHEDRSRLRVDSRLLVDAMVRICGSVALIVAVANDRR